MKPIPDILVRNYLPFADLLPTLFDCCEKTNPLFDVLPRRRIGHPLDRIEDQVFRAHSTNLLVSGKSSSAVLELISPEPWLQPFRKLRM